MDEIMRRRRLLLGISILLVYSATWIGGWFSLNQDVKQTAELAYRRAEQTNQEQIAEAKRFGVDPGFLIPLHDGGPIASEWCIPVLPGILYRHWEQSIGPLGGGGGSSLHFYYGVDSTELASLSGWRN